jgi:hypothetical protein
MRRPEGEKAVAALREEIRAAGHTTLRLRLEVLAIMGFLALLGLSGGFSVLTTSSTSFSDRVLQDAQPAFFLFGLVGLMAALPYAAAYRRLRRAQLRRKISALPTDRVSEVLLPLQAEMGDTRKLVEPLIRELGAGSEMVPASPPQGGGDEPAPSGPGR